MGLESPTYVTDLVASNPASGDSKSQGDDHIRNVKQALLNTFPDANHVIHFPVANAVGGSRSVSINEDNAILAVDTTTGPITLTLPSTLTGLNIWQVRIVKSSADNNPVFVAPPSGNIDGFAKIRINVPHEVIAFVWFGTFFTRLLPAGIPPPGTHIESASPNVPTGYLAEVGQSLARVDYPELFAVLGTTYGAADGSSFSLPNAVGTVLSSVDAASARLDAANLGISPATVGNVGGSKSHAVSVSELPAHNHPSPAVNDPTHSHTGGSLFDAFSNINTLTGGGAQTAVAVVNNTGAGATDAAATGITLGANTGNSGGGAAMPLVQPTMISNRILRAC